MEDENELIQKSIELDKQIEVEKQKRKPKSKLDKIEDKLDKLTGEEEKKLKKEWKLPWKVRLNKRKIAKNFITVMKINENKNIDFTREQIIDNTVKIDNLPRIATVDYTLMHKGKPFMIVPSWSVEPFCPSKNLEETEKRGMAIRGWKYIQARIETDAIKLKKSMGGILPWIIGIAILGIIGYSIMKG